MDREKRRKINRLAESVRSALKISKPDDVRNAISVLGGSIQNCDYFDPAEASILKSDETHFTIKIDATKPPTRQLFSIAHEIGHLFLHLGFGTDRWKAVTSYVLYNRLGANEEEYEANEFAAAFLMPESEFGEQLKRSGNDYSAIAKHFGVSADAAQNRGRWLGLLSWS